MGCPWQPIYDLDIECDEIGSGVIEEGEACHNGTETRHVQLGRATDANLPLFYVMLTANWLVMLVLLMWATRASWLVAVAQAHA